MGLCPPDTRLKACAVDEEIGEGAMIEVGDLTLRTIETPGHARGHISFLMKRDNQNVFFGGDLVFFSGKILLQNIPECDLQAQIASLVKLRESQIDVFLPGHLTFSLRNGQRHIDAALKIIDGLLVPPNFTYGW